MDQNIVQTNIDTHSVSKGKKPGKEALPGRSKSSHPCTTPYFGKMMLDFALIWLSIVS
jgi:hypothetical protein